MSTWNHSPDEDKMSRGPLYEENYHPQFSGHETFPLRYGWLKKAFDAITTSDETIDNRSVFLQEDAIAKFGVGKNMVASIRHWASSVGVIEDDQKSGRILPTVLGELLFGTADAKGLDPYLEDPSTLWLIHWQLCGRPTKTTWYWAFNHFPNDLFERHNLSDGLEKLASDRVWGRTAAATIKRDVECFVRTYVVRLAAGKTSSEDTLESPLAELGLIKPVGRRDGFRLVRGSKPSLGCGVFLFALIEFWLNSSYAGLNQLPFDAIARAPGSPGRVFLLDENDLADRLMNIEESSNGVLAWSETSGIKGIIKKPNRVFKDNPIYYIRNDYK